MSNGAEEIRIVTRPDMVVNADFQSLLAENDLLDYERIFRREGGTVVKKIEERSVVRLDLVQDGRPRRIFLKRHRAVRPDLGAWIGHGFSARGLSPGMAEFENIRDFRKSGLPTVTPVAAGERRTGPFRFESFLVTEDFAPYVSLERLIRERPERFAGPAGTPWKRRLLSAIGRLAAAMHAQGFNHRDFNATHILIGPGDETGAVFLALFDFQRVDRRTWLRMKWRVKLLAELFFTLPEPLFDREDRRLLYQAFRGAARIRPVDRFLLLLVERKIARIARHMRKVNARKQADRESGRRIG